MPIRQGYLVASTFAGKAATISASLSNYEAVTWPPGAFDAADVPRGGVRRGTFPVRSAATAKPGHLVKTYFDDFYNRIYVTPKRFDLGNLSTEQVREIEIWNAWLVPRTLSSADIVNGEGLDVTLPGALPLVWRPLQQRVIELNISIAGSATIDAQLILTFTGLDGITIPITGSRVFLWPLPADWARGVRESLEWMTAVQQSLDGSRDVEPQRECPRREFSIDYVADAKERRIIENAMFNWTGRIWTLPVFPEIELLAATLPATSTAIPMPGGTAGLDFAAGGQVALWRDINDYELVEVEAAGVEANQLLLARPTLRTWLAGTRVYPTRQARLQSAPQLARKNSQVVTFNATFDIDEPCDWPAVAPVATYLGIPVLEHRGDENEDPKAAYPRQLEVLDGSVGLVDVADITGYSWPTQSHAWRLYGRDERAAHRSMLYWLAGRAESLWLPTWTDDLQLVEAATSPGALLTIAWAGVTKFLGGAPGRRHIRIELYDGTVFYRRVEASEELDAQRERIALDPDLGQALAPEQVHLISWMALSAQASDRVEIQHLADSKGVADCAITFEGTPAEEPA